MRFHIGFSKRINWKWLLLIGGALLAFFGVGNHVALAATLTADATGVYVRSPMYDTESPAVDAGALLNQQSATTYNISWSSQRYSAFQTTTIGSSKYLAYGQELLKARLRWTYATSDMNKCSSSQAINYEFQFYLRDVSGTIPQKVSNGVASKWNNNIFSRVWIRSSSTNYDCSILSKESNIMRVQCTMPNPSAVVYVYLEDFNLFYVGGDTLYNVGLAPIQYTCSGLDSAGIINSVNNSTTSINENNNNNTTTIINNNNSNTQEIIDSNQANTQEIIDSITIPQPFTSEDLPTFAIDNMLITSQTQKLFMLPIQLLNYVIQGMDTPNVCQPLTINLSSLNGLLHANVGSISIPCMGTRVKNYIGENWYNTFDYLMGAIVFYYIASNIVLRIQQIFSGVDTLPSYYTSHGKTKTLIVNNDTGEVIG